MNKFRPIILAFSVVAAALLAYGFLTMPKPRPADHDGFSSARVLEDIEIISRAPHYPLAYQHGAKASAIIS